MSNQDEKMHGLKRLMEQVREELQDQLEAAEAKYGFDFQAGKPAKYSNSPLYIWTETPSVQSPESALQHF